MGSKVVQSLSSIDENIPKGLTNVVTVSKKGKEKNDFILTKKKIISPTHIKDKQVVDVDFGKDNGAQTYSHIKKTTLVISNMKGMSVSKDSLKKKKSIIATLGAKKMSAQSFSSQLVNEHYFFLHLPSKFFFFKCSQ